MQLTLIFCSFLFGLILAPTNGNVKYIQVLQRSSPESLLHSPVRTGEVGDGARNPIVTVNNYQSRRCDSAASETSSAVGHAGWTLAPWKPTAKDNVHGGKEEQRAGTLLSLSCFPPAYQLHKYDWTRYQLRQLAADKWKDQRRPFVREARKEETMRSTNGRVESPGDAAELKVLDRDTAKRSDYHREMSADLYAQYPSSCACQTKYELLDLGYTHFPRYIVNAICQNRSASSRKCWRGSSCKEIPYKVRVLTKRTDSESGEQDHHSTLLPEPLREYWRFKTVTIAAACQCSI